MTKYLLILLSLLGSAEILSASQVVLEKVLSYQRKPQHQKTNEPLFMSQIAKKKRSEQDKKMEVEGSIKSTHALQNATSQTPSEVIDSGEYVAPVRIVVLPMEATITSLSKSDTVTARERVTSQENQTISLESLLLNRAPEEKPALIEAFQALFGPRPARKKPVASEIARAVYDTQKTRPATAAALDVSIPSLNELLDGQEMKNVGPRVVKRFQQLRENGELTKEWGLDDDTISRLGRLIKLAREANTD